MGVFSKTNLRDLRNIGKIKKKENLEVK